MSSIVLFKKSNQEILHENMEAFISNSKNHLNSYRCNIDRSLSCATCHVNCNLIVYIFNEVSSYDYKIF